MILTVTLLMVIHATTIQNLAPIDNLATEAAVEAHTQEAHRVAEGDRQAGGHCERSDRAPGIRIRINNAGTFIRVAELRARSHARGRVAPTTSTPAQTQPSQQGVTGCDCGEDCKCPPFVCENGDCRKNYVIALGASWCAPCKRMRPVYEQLRKEGYALYYYDIDKFRDTAKQFSVRSVPTIIVMQDGKEIKRWVGSTSIDEIKKYAQSRDEQHEEHSETPYILTK